MTPRELVLFLRWRYDPRYADASDGALLEQYIHSRDEVALRALVSRHAGPLLNLCRLELGDFDAAEDAFQDTVLALHRRGRSIRDKQAVLAWMMSTARHICCDMRKQRTRRRRAENGAAKALRIEDSSVEPTRVEERQLVAKAIGQLPDRYGVPLHLGLQGLTPDQIAQSLGLPVATVKTRITRGRKRLLSKLQAGGVGAAAAGIVLAQRTDAAAAPIVLVAAAIKAALTDVPPAVGLAASLWWLKPALGVLMVGGVAAGGIGWGMREEPMPPPETAVVLETDEERDLRILRDVVTPQVTGFFRQWLIFGGGEIRIVNQKYRDTRLILELEAIHRLGFKSRMELSYQTLNGGLAIKLDQTADGNWKHIGWDSPILVQLPGMSSEKAIGLDMHDRLHAMFSVLPVRLPPIVPPGSEPELARSLQPFLGVWRWQGQARYPVELYYVDRDESQERVYYVSRYGGREELQPIVGSDGVLRLRLNDNWIVERNGGKLRRIGTDTYWWERVDDRPTP